MIMMYVQKYSKGQLKQSANPQISALKHLNQGYGKEHHSREEE